MMALVGLRMLMTGLMMPGSLRMAAEMDTRCLSSAE